MASLDRAYGVKGALIAGATAAVAGLVHGVLVAVTGWLAIKVLLLAAAAAMLVIGGTVSARQHTASMTAMAMAMVALFFWWRWLGWSAINDAGVFLGLGPGGWLAYIRGSGVFWLWLPEFSITASAAAFGCYAGFERAG